MIRRNIPTYLCLYKPPVEHIHTNIKNFHITVCSINTTKCIHLSTTVHAKFLNKVFESINFMTKKERRTFFTQFTSAGKTNQSLKMLIDATKSLSLSRMPHPRVMKLNKENIALLLVITKKTSN